PLVGLTTPVFLTFVAKHELFANPLSRYIITRLGGIPLNRKHPMESRRTLRAVRTHLQSRRALVVFPEGTYYPYSMGPGNLGMLRYIMSTAQVPLIPVGICYEKHRLRPGVRIRFGAPIHPNDTRGPHALLTEMMDRIAELSSLR
ncbi:MAG: 1-acyl-sn-glycerol-3-phosphate acyltransferase, partial [Desulfatitalea sp.]|nr:1-acyl-sn-glycerol-3-phosphate acyltransferase [Desulfatitalea sp.]